ncbi:MAG: hypothetical protein NT155_03185 [Candidatus Staskawiczbacteria bacterium]|nr:hypothetical protein [Candidatus Staskawiczbacteria bacterium]
MKSIKNIGAITLMAITLTLNLNADVAAKAGGPVIPPTVTDVTQLVTNSAAWSAALLDAKADRYDGVFYMYNMQGASIGYGLFTMKPFNGIFMISRFNVGETNEVYIDPTKPLPGFPSIGEACQLQMYVNGYAKMSNGQDRNTRYGSFWSGNFQPGDAIDISINPNQVQMVLAVNGLVGDHNNMTLQANGGYGYYDQYLSGLLGQTVFTVYVDPIQDPIGSTVNWIITDRSNGSTWSGQTTVSRGLGVTTVDASTSGMKFSNAGGVEEVILKPGESRYSSGTYRSASPWLAWTNAVTYLIVPADAGEMVNVETGGFAVFTVEGFNNGVFTNAAPSTGFRNEAYGLSGYAGYRIIVTSLLVPSEKTFGIYVWKSGTTSSSGGMGK